MRLGTFFQRQGGEVFLGQDVSDAPRLQARFRSLRVGFRRIVEEVSPYATTNMREATAELFKCWWCATPANPPSPLVARFGALLDQYYPAS